MRLDIGLGRFDQGLEPQAVARGVAPCVVCAHPILPDVKPQEVTSRLIALQGGMEAPFGLVPCQPQRCQPCHQALLAMFEAATVLRQHHTVIRIGDDTGRRVYLSQSFVHPVQGDQG
jgi:hypothetical protein